MPHSLAHHPILLLIRLHPIAVLPRVVPPKSTCLSEVFPAPSPGPIPLPTPWDPCRHLRGMWRGSRLGQGQGRGLRGRNGRAWAGAGLLGQCLASAWPARHGPWKGPAPPLCFGSFRPQEHHHGEENSWGSGKGSGWASPLASLQSSAGRVEPEWHHHSTPWPPSHPPQ